ncbi:MAG: hypothetical protein AAFR64_05720 [Pseudomonadota bacterium]
MSFGRKGVAGAAVGAQPARRRDPIAAGGGTSHLASSGPSAFAEPGSDVAAKRAAFIASERARRGDDGSKAPFATPARPIAEPIAEPASMPSWNPSAGATERAKKVSASNGSSAKPYSKIFGHPDKRRIILAYVLWYFAGMLSVHRIYCGNAESALYQFALLFISLVCLAIFPPLGLIGFLGWCGWLFVDLFFMPGMMRRFRAQHAYPDTGIFE